MSAAKLVVCLLLVSLCILAQAPPVAVYTALPERPTIDGDGPALTADDIARGIQALRRRNALTEAQDKRIGEWIKLGRQLRSKQSSLQAKRSTLQLRASIEAATLLKPYLPAHGDSMIGGRP